MVLGLVAARATRMVTRFRESKGVSEGVTGSSFLHSKHSFKQVKEPEVTPLVVGFDTYPSSHIPSQGLPGIYLGG
jgi:hypothetical protein